MNTIFNDTDRNGLIERLQSLSPDSKALWGKMTVCQMLKHRRLNEEMLQGKKHYPRLFIGRLFGKMALNGILKDDSQMKKNQPTHPELKIKGTGDFEQEKQQWLRLLSEYKHLGSADLMHPFFGKMTRKQIGEFVYKHTDHHLRQFNH